MKIFGQNLSFSSGVQVSGTKRSPTHKLRTLEILKVIHFKEFWEKIYFVQNMVTYASVLKQ